MYLLDVHNAHEMGENLEKHGSSPQLPFNFKSVVYLLIITKLGQLTSHDSETLSKENLSF